MTEKNVHPTAIIENGAQLGEGVVIEPYAVVKSNVTLHDRVVIKAHAYIDGYTTIGEGTTVYPSASIGTKTQDLKYRGEKTFVKIGKNCEIREFVTINSSCEENSVVQVGDNCLIMAYCHIAHHCVLGKNVIMTNNSALAGHIHVEDFAIIAGFTPIHQFVRVGCYAMVGGMSRVTQDIPPYTIGAGIPYRLGGLNIVGLKRHGFSLHTRQLLARAFKLVYRSGLNLKEALHIIENEIELIPEVKHWVDFCRQSKRGLSDLHGVTGKNIENEDSEAEKLATASI